MRRFRWIAILANACAVLLLVLAGTAVADPSLTFGNLDLYGPITFFSDVSGFFYGAIGSNSVNEVWSAGTLAAGPTGLSYYVVPDVPDILSLLSANILALSSDGITEVATLPATNSLFASVPEPLGLAVVVSGIAGLSFVRRRRGRATGRFQR